MRMEPCAQVSRHLYQADVEYRKYDVSYAGAAVVYMASLPLDINVYNQVRRSLDPKGSANEEFQTLVATNMPFVGRG